jgi:hypothetical protein
MKALRLALCLTPVLLTACAGMSSEEAERLRLLDYKAQQEAAAEQAKIKAKEDNRYITRLSNAKSAITQSHTIDQAFVASLFQSIDPFLAGLQPGEFDTQTTHFVNYNIFIGKYDYDRNMMPLTIEGIRNVKDLSPYNELFPDAGASYTPGQKSRPVLEFTLMEETRTNRTGKKVLLDGGQRWVSATQNFKYIKTFRPSNNKSQFVDKLFHDIELSASGKQANQLKADRSLTLQIGFSICEDEGTCVTKFDWNNHPTLAAKSRILSMVLFNAKDGRILTSFVDDQE